MESILIQASEQMIFHIGESSQIAAARRNGNDLAVHLGFDEVQAGKVAIVITEAGTNILKHAGSGDIILRPLWCDQQAGIEIIATDNGPGMASVAASISDGVSTAGTQGTGLGAMRRLAGEFDIYSAPDRGTALWLVVWSKPDCPRGSAINIGAICLPLPSEEISGDAWTYKASGRTLRVMVADGLGHGPDARRASQPAIDVVDNELATTPRSILTAAHGALRSTRGAAVAVAVIDLEVRQLTFAGVGNIAAYLFSDDGRKQFMSHNGIVGNNMRNVQEFTFDWGPRSMLIMHSDGLLTNWSLDQYPGLDSHSPALIAAVLVRDFSRKRDDITVVVIRQD